MIQQPGSPHDLLHCPLQQELATAGLGRRHFFPERQGENLGLEGGNKEALVFLVPDQDLYPLIPGSQLGDDSGRRGRDGQVIFRTPGLAGPGRG